MVQSDSISRAKRPWISNTGDSEIYVDVRIRLFLRGKLTTPDGTDLEITEHTAFTNNFLHSLFSQCNISLNDVIVTQSSDLYNYRAYLETLLIYGTDASQTHLTNAYWYLDGPEFVPCDPIQAISKNSGFVVRWKRWMQSKEFQMIGRIHADLFNLRRLLIPGVKINVRLTKAKDGFHLMNT
jgi:hypothetical protein